MNAHTSAEFHWAEFLKQILGSLILRSVKDMGPNVQITSTSVEASYKNRGLSTCRATLFTGDNGLRIELGPHFTEWAVADWIALSPDEIAAKFHQETSG